MTASKPARTIHSRRAPVTAGPAQGGAAAPERPKGLGADRALRVPGQLEFRRQLREGRAGPGIRAEPRQVLAVGEGRVVVESPGPVQRHKQPAEERLDGPAQIPARRRDSAKASRLSGVSATGGSTARSAGPGRSRRSSGQATRTSMTRSARKARAARAYTIQRTTPRPPWRCPPGTGRPAYRAAT